MSEGAELFSVSAERGVDEHDTACVALKVQCRDCEINVWVPLLELPLLLRVPSARWLAGALRIGTCVGAAVFWACDEGRISILVGHDDQTWDFGVFFPENHFPSLIAEVEREVGSSLAAPRAPG